MSDHTPDNLLFQLDALYNSLAALTQITLQEAELLANARVDDLQHTLRQKSRLIQQASDARETSRQEAATWLKVALTDHARLSTLVEDVAMDLEQREEFAEAYQQLTSTWQEIQVSLESLDRAQKTSERLARQGLEWIDSCLTNLTDPRQGNGPSTAYTRRGKALHSTSSFLKRQA